METLFICSIALIASGLTLFSGFGLGTILVPAFALYFPIDVAIALTAIVHFLTNLFKLGLLGKLANRSIILRFGLPSLFSSLAGAYLLTFIAHTEPLIYYSISGHVYAIMPVKLLIAAVILLFSLFEIIPALTKIQFHTKYLFLGGLLSGFFGGLSGNQGALRSAFLLRTQLSKQEFIATGVVIACIIDVSRLSIYSGKVLMAGSQINYTVMSLATLSAFLGAFLGNRFLEKITIRSFQLAVSVGLILFSLLLAAGLI